MPFVRAARRAFLFALLAPLARSAAQRAPQGAVERQWVHESWTVKDGLPVNSINALLQDRAGYIWAATFDGLVRFDGVRFTVFNSANAAQLPSNRIVRLTEGRDGTLWLATEQGHVVRFRDGRFTNVPFEGGRSISVPTLVVDASGGVWVGATDGLFVFRHDRLERVGAAVLHATVSALLERRDGSIWIGTLGDGVFRAMRDGQLTHVPTDPAIEAEGVVNLFEDASGTLWMSTRSALWALRDRAVRMRTARPLAQAAAVVQIRATGALYAEDELGVYRIDGDSLIALHRDAKRFVRRLWTDSSAVWVADGDDVYRDDARVFSFAEHYFISSFLFDREGSLWLGTDAGGLHRLRPALFTTFSVPEGLAHKNAYATYADRSGAIWVGTWGSGASRIDPVIGRVTTHATTPRFSSVNSFYEDRTGRLWVATGFSEAGPWICQPPAMACHAERPPDLGDGVVFALYGDAEDRIWAGTTKLLYRYDGARWTSFPPSSGAPEAVVRAFATTKDGAIWMGTNGGGLARYRDDTFARVTHADGLPSDLIRSLYVDADGWLWIGTEGRGLARLDPRAWGEGRASAANGRRIVRIGTADGLFDEVIHQILEDDAGRLWMNTNRGIFWVARAELLAFADGRATRVHSTAYAERDGMRNREGNGGVQPAGVKGRDGRLWFPTQDGVVVVNPTNVRRERRAPPLVVEQLVANGRTLPAAHDSIALAPTERDVQIEYTALTFLEPANVRFRYRLDPYDADWIDVGNRRAAFYTKLPPGHYAFRVEASDASGGWYEPGAGLALHVRPRVWETATFRWLSAAVISLLLVLAVRVREQRLRARARHLERLVDERTATLREQERELADRNERLQTLDRAKTRFFANVSHELRTPLTLTIGPLEDLRAATGGDPRVERWLDIALRNSRRLLRLVNQILDVAKLEAGAMRLTPRELDLVPFTRGLVAAFAPVAERSGLRLTIETVESLVGAFDADAVEKILTNLISNAIKFTPAEGTVSVALAHDANAARIVVRDSGLGIPPERLAHVFERFYHVDESAATRVQPGTGIGLSLVKELVELHGGRIAVESGATGTTFTATIPALPISVAAPAEAATAASDATKLDAIQDAPDADASDGRPSADVATLLVVDDSEDLRHWIRDHFADRFRVLEAADGAEGIEVARAELPDVVISDVMMPRADGHELVRTLRASADTDFLGIILLTARAGHEERLEGLEHGADDYIVKPFDMRELDVRVRTLLRARRRLRERFASAAPLAPPTAVADAAMSPADRPYAERVREAIRRGLSDPEFGVAELADAVAQDRSHLFRRVKQLFGESPSDLIRRLRLEEGERLLRAEPSATVSDVAYAVGFNSVSYFCRCFQEVYGETPAVYRVRA